MTDTYRAQGRRKSKFPADTIIPGNATLDFVASGANFKITLADYLASLNVTGSIIQAGDVTAVPVLDTAGAVHSIRNLEVSNTSGMSAAVSPQNGITLQLDAQVSSGTGIAVLDSNNKIRNIKAGSGVTLTLVGDDIVISVP